MMTAQMPLALLLLLFAFLAGVCPLRPTEIHVKAGELVALQCPRYRGYNHGDAKPIWTSHTTQEMNLTSNLSLAEQRQMGVLVYGRSLVIFSSSVNHQGNYSCTWRNTSRQYWFRLTVHTLKTREYEESTTYSKRCYERESCTLNCPDVNIPAVNIPNITSNGTTWHKEKDLKDGYFLSVKKSDLGVYTCTRSYLYHGQIYNKTFTLVLDVKPKKKLDKSPVISSPQMGDVFYVDLGSTVVIDCKAVLYSDFDEVFWLSGRSFVERNNSLPVFYNYTSEYNTEGIKTTASLVFKKVSEEDLSKNYTCKLESTSEPSRFVTITMAQKASSFSLSMALGIGVILVVIVLTAVAYVKRKMNISLFLRDNLVGYRITSDGKSYDAFLMYYKSGTEAGLHEGDRRWLKSVLEVRFGYSLCVYDPNTSPGKAVAQAVLDCIEQSRTVSLIPTPVDPWLGFDTLKDIHAALLQRQTQLVFVITEAAEVSRSRLLPEALQHLGQAGVSITWKGRRSSSFWNQLLSHLPSRQHAPKTKLAA